MKISGKAIIVSKKILEENSAILTLLSREHGVCSGFIKKVSNKAGIDPYQAGNLVDFEWSARLSSHMGKLKLELVKSYSYGIMRDKYKLYSMNSLLSIIAQCLKPHEKYPHLFDAIHQYIDRIVISDFSFLDYIKLELLILSEIGYSLDISKCCSSGTTNDLAYVSPKTGRAVSAELGRPYKSKLLPLPHFLTKEIEPANSLDVQNAFELTGYFFKRYIFKDGQVPNYREMLYSLA